MDNEKLIRLEEEYKHLEDKMNIVEKKVENIYELTISVREIANEVKAMREDMNKIDKRVTTIEEKPVKRWEDIVTTIIGTVVGAIAGAVIALVLK